MYIQIMFNRFYKINNEINDITLMGQYIKDLSFESPMAPNLPSMDKEPK